MAYEFKKLSEVVVAESVTDETNVLIEEDGMIKKTARKNIGNVKSVNGVEPDDTGDVVIEIPEPPASFSQVTYYVTGSSNNLYLYIDAEMTTKVTAAEVSSLLAEGKNIFEIKMAGAPFDISLYPIAIFQPETFFVFIVFFPMMSESPVEFFTAEYEAEEPVGPPV